MGIHVELSEEAKERYKKQKAKATLTSFMVSIFFIGCLAAMLAALTILIPTKEVETIISYKAPPVEQNIENKPVIQKMQRQLPTPAAASASITNVITTVSPTAISIPDTNQMVDVESLDFGSSNDFGMGFGFEESNNSSTTFFGQTVSGSRICYVIDYSLSMKGRREELMRNELTDSVKDLQGGAEFSLIFFSGCTWQSSDKIELGPGRDGRQGFIISSVQEDGETVEWNGGFRIDEREYDKFKPNWLKPSEKNIEKAVTEIRDTPLNMGTDWQKPLLKALEMKPAPEIIVFMTDGHSGSQSTSIAEHVGELASKKSIVINTISLLEPNAKDDMKRLAELTGGTATMVVSENEIHNLMTGEITKR